jgi:prophage regulatory protein
MSVAKRGAATMSTHGPVARERPRLRVLRLREVEKTTGIKRSTIYENMERGAFPKPIALAPRSVGWLQHEIDAWVESRVRERDAGQSPQVVRRLLTGEDQ